MGMGRRLLFLNLLLIAGIGLCAQQLLSGWREFQSEENVGLMVEDARGTIGAQPEGTSDLIGEEALFHDFFVIAERDLFSPERRPESEEDEDASDLEPPEFPKRPQMHGATTIDGERKAFLTLFDSAKSTGSSKIVGLGETVQEYTVAEITDTTVTLRWNEHEEVIDIMDSEPGQPRAPAAARVAAVNIIRIGSHHAAVETTSPDEAEQAEGGGAGIDIGMVSGQEVQPGAVGRAQRMLGGRRGVGMPGQVAQPTNLGVPQPRGRAEQPVN